MSKAQMNNSDLCCFDIGTSRGEARLAVVCRFEDLPLLELSPRSWGGNRGSYRQLSYFGRAAQQRDVTSKFMTLRAIHVVDTSVSHHPVTLRLGSAVKHGFGTPGQGKRRVGGYQTPGLAAYVPVAVTGRGDALPAPRLLDENHCCWQRTASSSDKCSACTRRELEYVVVLRGSGGSLHTNFPPNLISTVSFGMPKNALCVSR
jgi:hypothetical protein